MIELARDGYTRQEVIDALHGKRGSRKVKFRYELLDKHDNKKADLYNVLAADISFGAFNEIKRTANFTVKEIGIIDWLSDRIKPYMDLHMGMGRWISFPLGIFLLSSPEKTDTPNGVMRSIEAYDSSIILRDDRVDDIYTVVQGTNYKQAVISLLESARITKYIIEDTDKVTSIDIQFEIGTPKLTIVNKLLSLLDYTPIYVDANGYFISRKYIVPTSRAIDYMYKDDELSVTFKGMSEELDLFDTPNKWIVVRTNEEEAPLRSVYTNSNPDSPTSTVSRGRTIVDYREIDNIADQAALDSYTQRIAFEASQVYGKLKFDTAIMPMHEYSDVLKIEYSHLNINAAFVETAWNFRLEAGGKMTHEVRRVVTI